MSNNQSLKQKIENELHEVWVSLWLLSKENYLWSVFDLQYVCTCVCVWIPDKICYENIFYIPPLMPRLQHINKRQKVMQVLKNASERHCLIV